MPVQCLLTVNGVQLSFATGCYCLPVHWDYVQKRAKAKSPEGTKINLEINRLSVRFEAIRAEHEIEGVKLSVYQLRELLIGNPVPATWLTVFEAYLKYKEQKQKAGKIESSTFKKWITFYRNLKLWLEAVGRADINLIEIKKTDFESIALYFQNECAFDSNYTAKILSGSCTTVCSRLRLAESQSIRGAGCVKGV